MSKVISANEIVTGLVVFLSADGRWVDTIDAAAVYADAAAADVGMAHAKRDEKRAIVIDPFVVDRKDGVEGRQAMTLRNAIRAYGPTIDYRPAGQTRNA